MRLYLAEQLDRRIHQGPVAKRPASRSTTDRLN
jgi:hypothetical protein